MAVNLRNVRMKNAILEGRNRKAPLRISVEGISETEDRVVDGRSDTLVRWAERRDRRDLK